VIEKFKLPPGREMIAGLIRENSSGLVPEKSEIKRAWLKLNLILTEKKIRKSPVFSYGMAAIALAASLTVVFIFFNPAAHKEKFSAHFSSFNHGLFVQRGDKKITVENGLSIVNGDIVENDSLSTTALKSEGNFKAVIKPGTRAVFQTIASSGRFSPEILLEKGGMEFNVKKLEKGESFQIRASDIRISAVGTVFEITRLDNGIMAAVKRGKVAVYRGTNTENICEIPAGIEALIPETGKIVSNSLDKNSSEDLGTVEEDSLASTNNSLLIKTPGVASRIYINNREYGSAPVGFDMPGNSSVDIEAVGDNGVVGRFENLKPDRDSLLAIDLGTASHPLYSSLSDMEGARIRMNLSPGIIAVSGGSKGFIYDINSGSLLKIPPAESEWKLLKIINNKDILMVNASGLAVCYNSGGKLKWSLSVPGTLWYGTEIASNDKYSVLSTMDRGIYIFSNKGRMFEHIDTYIAGPGFSSPVIDGNDILYYTDESGKLTSYSINNGRIIWQVILESVSAHPLIESEEAITVYFRDSGTFRSYSKQNGSLLWTAVVPNAALMDAKIISRQGFIALFFNTDAGGRVFIVDQKSGIVKGNIPTQSKISAVLPSSSAVWIATDDLILAGYDIHTMGRSNYYHLGSPAVEMDGLKERLWLLCDKGIDSIRIK
jgi:outer membrane protein assembly factor BamB